MTNVGDNFWSCPLWIRKNRQSLNCKFIYRVMSIILSKGVGRHTHVMLIRVKNSWSTVYKSHEFIWLMKRLARENDTNKLNRAEG